MNNFIFKSPRRLIKNPSINTERIVMNKLEIIQRELRHQRQDNKDMMLMLNKLLIDKHLQMQVDEYFTDNTPDDEETSPQTDLEDK